MSSSDLTTESTIYVTYIAATREQCWSALTSAEFTRQYFFGNSVESDWKKGSPWLLRKPDGSVSVNGEVRESDPPHKLVVSWIVAGPAEFRNLPEAVVTYEIEALNETTVRLTMTEAHPTPIPAYLLDGGRRGWPAIISGLKSLLETGRPLVIPTPKPPKES